jgi:hypothetical protein
MKTEISRGSKTVLLLMSATLAAQQQPSPAISLGAGLESLPHGFYYQSAQEWKKLEVTSSSGFRTTHGMSALAGVPPGVVRLYDGSEAPNQFENRRPVFGIRVDASRPDTPGLNVRDLVIVRLVKKKGHRELDVMQGAFASERVGLNSKDVVEVTLATLADRTFTLVPKTDLARGEYVITFRGANGAAGYDFGIK